MVTPLPGNSVAMMSPVSARPTLRSANETVTFSLGSMALFVGPLSNSKTAPAAIIAGVRLSMIVSVAFVGLASVAPPVGLDKFKFRKATDRRKGWLISGTRNVLAGSVSAKVGVPLAAT